MKYEESARLELKEKVNADFKKEIIAFANTDGGEILVGINRDGVVVGVGDAEAEMEKISNMIRDGIKPDLTACTSMERMEEDGKAWIRITVSRGLKRPYHLTDKGLKPSGVYVRHGVSSAPASDEAIRQMIKESDGTTFDRARSVNQELTFVYAEHFFSERNLKFDRAHKRTLYLLDEDWYYTNAAWLLSDQCAHIIRCAVYEGTGKNRFKTRREFSGSILKQMEDAYEFLSLNNNVRASFEGLRRIDHMDYPEAALREALLNAVVHRDYDYSGSIIINIYEDRMEFISLGGLVKGLTLKDIKSGISQPRNQVIADIFYRLELIESYGTGIQKMLESYTGCAGGPSFSPAPASFVVTLPNRNQTEEIAYVPELSKEENIIRLIRKKGTITRKDVEQFLECSSFPAGKVLRELIEKGQIVRTGAAKGTRYREKGGTQ